MKTSRNWFAADAASASSASVAIRSEFGSFVRTPGQASGLIEEAALDQPLALFRGDLHVPRREEEHLVGNALHPAVEGVSEAAREVDQPLRQLVVDSLQVEDHRDRILEAVGDVLRVLEALRQHEVHLHRRNRLNNAVRPPRAASGRRQPRRILLGLGIGPVVEVLLLAPARRQPTDVRALAVRALDVLLSEVAVLVPFVLLLGDPEVDEGPGPNVGKAHIGANVISGTGSSPGAPSWRPRRLPPGNPGSFPSRARGGRNARPARAGA